MHTESNGDVLNIFCSPAMMTQGPKSHWLQLDESEVYFKWKLEQKPGTVCVKRKKKKKKRTDLPPNIIFIHSTSFWLQLHKVCWTGFWKINNYHKPDSSHLTIHCIFLKSKGLNLAISYVHSEEIPDSLKKMSRSKMHRKIRFNIFPVAQWPQ